MMKHLERHGGHSPDILTSPLVPSKSRSQIAKDLWQNNDYREKTVEALKGRRNNPEFIAKMQQLSKGMLSPMDGKRHSEETVAKIRATTQENWNKRHGIEQADDPLAKRNALISEWLRLSQLLGHSPSSTEITMLNKQRATKFSITMYKKEFGQGSFTRAKEILICINSIQNFMTSLLHNPSKILRGSVLEKDIKTTYETVMAELQSIFSTPSIDNVREKVEALNAKISQIKGGLTAKRHTIDLHIGNDERGMWAYAVQNNLLSEILQTNMVTQQEIDLLRRYFENGIIAENLTETIFNRFTVAVARVS